MDKLRAHFERMQEMTARYLEPGQYVDRNGKVAAAHDDEARMSLWENDIIHMLDGPEQREAQTPTRSAWTAPPPTEGELINYWHMRVIRDLENHVNRIVGGAE